jgi:hypothetical protein
MQLLFLEHFIKISAENLLVLLGKDLRLEREIGD